MRVLLCRLGSPDHLFVASALPPLVSTAVNGNPPLRYRRSELIAKLGYELNSLCYLLTLIPSTKDAMFLSKYEIDPSTEIIL